MLVNGKMLHASVACVVEATGALVLGPLPGSDFQIGALGFSGSVADWSELGFSICETYLLEVQSLFLEQDLGGFLSMAEAQFDPDLADEVLAHANALLAGVAFQHRAGEVQLVGTVEEAGLDWKCVADLWAAMKVTQGDMRMPRLDATFEKALRSAQRLS